MPTRAETPPNDDELLTDAEVTALTKIQRNTLANWRATGQGPRFVKLGKRSVRYRRSDLRAFIDGAAA